MEPRETDYLSVNISLLEAVHRLVPLASQAEVSRIINSIRWAESEEKKEKVVTHYLLSVMLDGIRHGNWPLNTVSK